MNDVLITGAGGLIGSWLVKTAPEFAPGKTVIGLSHPQLELTDFAAVRREFHRLGPGLVIHCASWGGNQNAADGGVDVRVTLGKL